MKAGWKRVKLGEAISAIGDHRGRTPPKLTIGKYRVLSAKNIKTGKIVAEDSIGYFDDELYAKYVRMEIERGDIIITSEAPFGQVYYWNSDEKVALSQRLFSIRMNDGFEPRFVYYYLTTDRFQAELASRASGTTVVDAVEFLSTSLEAVLELFDALAETIPDFIEFRGGMNAGFPVSRAIGRGRHRREKGGTHPVGKLKQGMVFAVTEKRKLGQITVGRAHQHLRMRRKGATLVSDWQCRIVGDEASGRGRCPHRPATTHKRSLRCPGVSAGWGHPALPLRTSVPNLATLSKDFQPLVGVQGLCVRKGKMKAGISPRLQRRLLRLPVTPVLPFVGLYYRIFAAEA